MAPPRPPPTVSGTGLCWINNVGSVTLALLSEGNPEYDLVEVAKYQAVQVSVISIWNCLGRVSMGGWCRQSWDVRRACV